MRTGRLIGVVLALAAATALFGCGSGGSSTTVAANPPKGVAAFKPCPRYAPVELEYGTVKPGTEGDAVPPGPTSALLCRWAVSRKNREVRAEGMVPEGSLRGLVRILNSLPPPAEGEYDCEEGTPLNYLIVFRYPDGSKVRTTVTYSGCGLATNLNDRTYLLASEGLRRAMDRALRK